MGLGGHDWCVCVVQALLKTAAVPLMGKLLATDNVDVLIPMVGTLQECASEVSCLQHKRVHMT